MKHNATNPQVAEVTATNDSATVAEVKSPFVLAMESARPAVKEALAPMVEMIEAQREIIANVSKNNANDAVITDTENNLVKLSESGMPGMDIALASLRSSEPYVAMIERNKTREATLTEARATLANYLGIIRVCLADIIGAAGVGTKSATVGSGAPRVRNGKWHISYSANPKLSTKEIAAICGIVDKGQSFPAAIAKHIKKSPVEGLTATFITV